MKSSANFGFFERLNKIVERKETDTNTKNNKYTGKKQL